jgi:protein required for attachment to host cells
MKTHTPGPWHEEALEIFADEDCNLHPIANCFGNHTCRSVEEQRANALLIAAAPEMFEALRQVMHIDQMDLYSEGALPKEVTDQIYAALLKATGK